MDNLKGFLTGMIVRWLLKMIGGYLVINGSVNTQSLTSELTQIVGGLVTIALGVVISLIQHKQALAQVPSATVKG